MLERLPVELGVPEGVGEGEEVVVGVGVGVGLAVVVPLVVLERERVEVGVTLGLTVGEVLTESDAASLIRPAGQARPGQSGRPARPAGQSPSQGQFGVKIWPVFRRLFRASQSVSRLKKKVVRNDVFRRLSCRLAGLNKFHHSE